MTLEIRDVHPDDEAAWASLYRGYRDFYALEPSDAVVARTWNWVRDRHHGVSGLVADLDGRLVGFANIRDFARPSSGTIGLFLDDLFTTPDARGHGAATALLHRIARIAHERDASVVRWITADANATARRLYDRVATQTPWVTYDMRPQA